MYVPTMGVKDYGEFICGNPISCYWICLKEWTRIVLTYSIK